MGEYTAKVFGCAERDPDAAGVTSTLGAIVVNTALELDESFGRVIVGEGEDVVLYPVMRVRDVYASTTILCESRRPGGFAKQQADIELVASRIAEILNHPGSTVEVMDRNPFYKP